MAVLGHAYLVKTSATQSYTSLYIWKFGASDGPSVGDYELRPLSELSGTAYSTSTPTPYFYAQNRRLIVPTASDSAVNVERIYTGFMLVPAAPPYLLTRDLVAAVNEGGRVVRVSGQAASPVLTLLPAGTPIDTGGPTGPTGSTGPTGPTVPETDTGVIGTWNNWRGTSTSAMKAGDISYLSSGVAVRFHPTDSAGVDHDAEIHSWQQGDVITLTQGTKVATITLTAAPNPTSTTSTTQYIQVPMSVTGTPLSGFTTGAAVTVAKPAAAAAAGGIKKVHAGGNAAAATIMAGGVAARKIYAGSTLVWEA